MDFLTQKFLFYWIHGISRGIKETVYIYIAMRDFWGVMKKEVLEFARGEQEKVLWNFQGSWLMSLEFSMAVTQFCRIKFSLIVDDYTERKSKDERFFER